MTGNTSTIKLFDDFSFTARDILKAVEHGILATDLEANILFWNKGCEQIFGYSEEEILHKSATILYPENRRDEIKLELKKIIDGEPMAGPWHGRHKNGSIVWIDTKTRLLHDEEGTPVVILASVYDMQERKELESDLEESRARVQAILDNTVEAIITIDTDGIIQSFNKKAEELFGYQQEEAIGQNVKILMPRPHRANHDQYIANYLETGEKKIIGIGREERGRRKDGTVFPMELSVSEVTWNGNTIFTGIIRDISRRRKLENEILEISEDERRRIGQELHDGLGQMLTGIGLISQNVAKKLEANGLPGADEVYEISAMIKEADEYARSLSHGLVPIEVDEEGLRDAFKQLTRRAEKLFKIECIFEKNGNIKIEKKNITLHLYRIGQEAINNAVKHGKADLVKVRLSGNDHSINLLVEDNGVGFEDSLQKAKRKGLGIHTMQYRAHILGGQIEINENEEGWTQVACKIPYHS